MCSFSNFQVLFEYFVSILSSVCCTLRVNIRELCSRIERNLSSFVLVYFSVLKSILIF